MLRFNTFEPSLFKIYMTFKRKSHNTLHIYVLCAHCANIKL